MKKFAVIGNPINHSISPRLHNLALKAFNLKGFYSRLNLLNSNQLLNSIDELNLDAVNITIPYKNVAFLYSDFQDNLCKNIGSANTLIKKNSKFYAYNTDILGFLKAIENYSFKTALIIGAGGSVKALAYGLNLQGKSVDILNKSIKSEDFFVQNFYTYENFKLKNYDLIINATPNGLINSDLPAPNGIILPLLQNAKFSFDLIYGLQTPFLELSKKLNLIIQDGSNMLLFQAAYAFNLFYDNEFKFEDIVNVMKPVFSLKR